MLRSICALACVLMILPMGSSLATAPGAPGLQREKCSSVRVWKDEVGVIHRLTRNVRYSFLRVDGVDPKGDVPILLEETIENDKPEGGGEGWDSKITARANWTRPDLSTTELWKVENPDDDAEIYYQNEVVPLFYKTTKRGCCGGEDSSRFYSLASGKLVMSCSADAVAVEGADLESRVAVTFNSQMVDLPNLKKRPEIARASGVLSLYAKDRLVRSYWVFSEEVSPALKLRGDKVLLVLSPTLTVLVPIGVKGELDLDGMTPKGKVTLEPVTAKSPP